jgi:hypothetical protein
VGGFSPEVLATHRETDCDGDAVERMAYQDLLHRLDDPNDTFNEDDLELLVQDD